MTYHAYFTLPKIVRWSVAADWKQASDNAPIHLLTGKNDWLLACWMLASWMHFTKTVWPVVIHDDGTLPDEARGTLAKLFPKISFIGRSEADAKMTAQLAAFPHCRKYRETHPLALKIFDMPHFCRAERLLVFDSDVLFFREPEAVLKWSKNGEDECWFNQDVAESSPVSEREALDILNVKLWPRVNSGLCLISKRAIDLNLCERAFAKTSILRGHIWRVEQTLFALCASHHERGGLLPAQYEVSLGRRAAPDAIARHYVGAVRDRFYGEGLARLHRELLAKP